MFSPFFTSGPAHATERHVAVPDRAVSRHYFEAEAIKQQRLKQMRLENQAYLSEAQEKRDESTSDATGAAKKIQKDEKNG